MNKKDRDLLYLYYCYTQFTYKSKIPTNYGKWVEGKPWYGPLVKSDYEQIERAVMFDKLIIKKLKEYKGE